MQALLTLYGISPVCDTMCSRSSIRRLNTSGQAEHVNTCERGGIGFHRTHSLTWSPQFSSPAQQMALAPSYSVQTTPTEAKSCTVQSPGAVKQK